MMLALGVGKPNELLPVFDVPKFWPRTGRLVVAQGEIHLCQMCYCFPDVAGLRSLKALICR
jgi:hypothetical protein